MKNISERLAFAIKQSGKSKGELAQFLRVPASSVSRWLAGGASPRAERIIEMAKFLNVDVKWLMTGEVAESSTFPKQSRLGDAACQACADPLREDAPDYRCTPALTLEERVERLETAMRAMEAALKHI